MLFDVYEAMVTGDGSPRTVEVDASEAEPLVGMSLLSGHELTIAIIEGGSVKIRPLSDL